jgi:hypothetical protein
MYIPHHGKRPDEREIDCFLFLTDTRYPYTVGDHTEPCSWWGLNMSHIHVRPIPFILHRITTLTLPLQVTFHSFVHPQSGEFCLYLHHIGRTVRVRAEKGVVYHLGNGISDDFGHAITQPRPLAQQEQKQITDWIRKKYKDKGRDTIAHPDGLMELYVAEADRGYKKAQELFWDMLVMMEKGKPETQDGQLEETGDREPP